MSLSNRRAGLAIAGAVLFPILIAIAPQSSAFAQGTPTSVAASKTDLSPAERVGMRITELHDKLHITPDQETRWSDVAQIMRDNELKMNGAITDRSSKLKTMTAVEDLKSYQMVMDEHSDGLKRLIPAFESLYDGMTPAQKKNADHVFDQHTQRAVHGN